MCQYIFDDQVEDIFELDHIDENSKSYAFLKTKLVGKNKKIKEKRKIANRKNVPSSSSIAKFQTESPDV